MHTNVVQAEQLLRQVDSLKSFCKRQMEQIMPLPNGLDNLTLMFCDHAGVLAPLTLCTFLSSCFALSSLLVEPGLEQPCPTKMHVLKVSTDFPGCAEFQVPDAYLMECQRELQSMCAARRFLITGFTFFRSG